MATKNSNQKKRGRPPGRSEKGRQSQELLYQTAIRLFSEQGYAETTLRQIAREAGVSPALLYKYFPSKVAVVLELYDRLSLGFEARAQEMPKGTWRVRAFFALAESLASLRGHRGAMRALIPVMISDSSYGLFSENTTFSRSRVQGQFERAISDATDAPKGGVGKALGNLFYMLQLAVILWWLLDRSPAQRATTGLIQLLESLGGPVSMLLRLPGTGSVLLRLDDLVRESFYGEEIAYGS